MIIDITKELLSAVPYEGDPKPCLTRLKTVEKDGYYLSLLSTCVHAGSHIDAPLHFIEQGIDVAALPLEGFLNRCRVLNLDEKVTAEDLEKVPCDCPILLFKGNTHFSENAAEYLKSKNVLTVGVGGLSVADEEEEREVHLAFFNHGINIIENLDLERAEEGEYYFSGLPLKISGSEASPIRAVLFTII